MAYSIVDPQAGIVNLYDADPVGPGPFNLAGGGVTLGRESFYFQKVKAVDPILGGGEFIYAKNSTANGAGQTISSATTAAGTSIATVTTASAHGLQPGAMVIMAGQVPSGYVGTWKVLTVPSTTTFTIDHGSTNLGALTTVGTYTYGVIQPSSLVSFSNAITSGLAIVSAGLAASTASTGTTLGFALIGLLNGQWGWFQVGGVAVATISAGTPASADPVYLGTAGKVTPTQANGKQIINAQFAAAVSQTLGSGSAAVTLTSTQALVLINNPCTQSQVV